MGLTNFKIKNEKIGVRLHDGRGLYLTLSSNGRGKWTCRYMLNRKAKEMGLGRYPEVSLAEARKRHFEARIKISDGIDPIENKRRALALAKKEESLLFSKVKDNYIEEHGPKWSNAKHAFDWDSSLNRYACLIFDLKPFSKLQTEDILLVLKPIWRSKHETARKLQNRLKLIFGYAKAGGLYKGDNPAAWLDHLCHYFPMFDGAHWVKHHRALQFSLAPAFFTDLRRIETMAAKALQFTTLTAARTTETLGARAEEFDLNKKLWRVPEARMKARKPHEVPLSDQVCVLIEDTIRSHNAPYLFHGRNPEKPLSNMAMLNLVKKQLHQWQTTVHGLRSTFRTWAGEKTNYSPGIIEFALAHQLDEKIEGAYLRSELVEPRRPLMQDWANYLTADAPETNIEISLSN